MNKIDIDGLRGEEGKSEDTSEKMCAVQKGINTVAGIILLELNIVYFITYACLIIGGVNLILKS